MWKGQRSQIKEPPMAKFGTLDQQNKVVLDYNPKYKINIQESVLTDDWINKYMGVDRHISHAKEFQTIYVDTQPSRRWGITPTPSKWAAHLTFFQGVQCEKGRGVGGWVPLEWRNLTDTTLARWSRSTSTGINHSDSLYPWYGVMRMALLSLSLLPRNP